MNNKENTTPTLGGMVPCAFADCPPGLFCWQGLLCFKSEYSSKPGQQDAYCVDTGEYFWGGTSGDLEKRRALIVTPVAAAPASPIPTSVNGAGERDSIGTRARRMIAEAMFGKGAKPASSVTVLHEDAETAIDPDDGMWLHNNVVERLLILALSPALDNTADVALKQIARAHKDWDSEATFASSELAKCSRIAQEVIDQHNLSGHYTRCSARDGFGCDCPAGNQAALDNTAVERQLREAGGILAKALEAIASRKWNSKPDAVAIADAALLASQRVMTRATLTAETEKA